jgi:4-carboxymuconolactone decarboxylase
MPAKAVTSKRAKAANKMPTPRVSILAEDKLTAPQRALLDSIRSGPRGGSTTIRGPFAVFLHAPALGVPARLSELAILVTAKLWRAQYEWYAHVPQAERAGVKKETIRALHKGQVPKSAPKDERAIYDFVHELYKTKRVSDRTFKRVADVLGETATIELVGILGYYVLISMILNVFRMSPPEGEALPFAEKTSA